MRDCVDGEHEETARRRDERYLSAESTGPRNEVVVVVAVAPRRRGAD